MPDLAGLFDELLATEPGLPALVQVGHVTTFGDWWSDSAVIASALADTVRPGTAREFLDKALTDAGKTRGAHGWQLVGAWHTAMRGDDETILLWAIPTWEQWATVEQSLATGKEDVLLPTSRDVIETRQRILLADAPLCPFKTGRQPSRDDRTDWVD